MCHFSVAVIGFTLVEANFTISADTVPSEGDEGWGLIQLLIFFYAGSTLLERWQRRFNNIISAPIFNPQVEDISGYSFFFSLLNNGYGRRHLWILFFYIFFSPYFVIEGVLRFVPRGSSLVSKGRYFRPRGGFIGFRWAKM